MLTIRMQRTGRKGHAMFRMVVQDSRRTPTSGKIVTQLGSYDPHAKTLIVDKEKASLYLSNGAQPSDRTARLLQAEGVKMPAWVKLAANKDRTVRNADKRRSTMPPAPKEEAPVAEVEEAAPVEVEAAPAEAPTEAAASTDEVAVEEPATETTEAPAETEEPAAEDSAEPAAEADEAPAENA